MLLFFTNHLISKRRLYLYLLTPTKERKLNTHIVKMSTQQNATFLPDFYANLEDQ